MVITSPDLAPGFQLAGVETFAVDGVGEAAAALRRLLAEGEAGLIVIRRAWVDRLDPQLQHLIETSYQPVVMAIPDGRPTTGTAATRRDLADFIRRTIGFQITFGAEQQHVE
jgi:vacuolar-type H+-ATPase subunit F/Vma7